MGAIGDIASTIGRGISNLMHMGGRKVKQVPDLIDLKRVQQSSFGSVRSVVHYLGSGKRAYRKEGSSET